MRRGLALLALLALPLLLAACGSSERATEPLPARGPAGVVRVALDRVPWPLDPALATGRDETTLARALFATPLRTDPDTGALRPGLCTSWRSGRGGREWRLRCAHAPAIAAAVMRAAALPVSPGRWLFAPVERIRASADELDVRLRFPWVRFPYALTAVATALREVPGPFRVVAARPGRIVARRAGLRLVVRKLSPVAAARAFRRGEVDEARVPLGDLGALRRDPRFRDALRVRPLLGVDLVAFDVLGGPLAALPNTRAAYVRSVDRDEYDALVPEGAAPAAYGLLGRGPSSPLLRRRVRSAIGDLPPVDAALAVPREPDLDYAASVVAAQWRDLGLGASVVPSADPLTGHAWFFRLVAAYPQAEALPAALLLPHGPPNPWLGSQSRARALLLRALAEPQAAHALRRVDDALAAQSAIVPLAGVASARLVSPRLRGWRQDRLGDVDYARVTAL